EREGEGEEEVGVVEGRVWFGLRVEVEKDGKDEEGKEEEERRADWESDAREEEEEQDGETEEEEEEENGGAVLREGKRDTGELYLQAPTGNQPFSPNSPHSPQIHPLQHSLLPPSRWHQLRLPSHLPHHHHSPPLPRPRPPPPPSPRLPPPPRPSPAPAPVPAPAPAVPVAAASDHSHPPYCLPQNCPARPRSSPHVQGSHSYDTSQPLLPSPHALSVALCPPLPSALCLPFPLSCSTLQLYILHSPPPPSPHLSQSSSPSFSNTAPRLSQQ
ncbi:unnamed protein product, partial [Closterium sp. NIES-53]